MLLLSSPVPLESVLNQQNPLALLSMELLFGWFSSVNWLNGWVHGEQQEHTAESREGKWAS